MNTNAIQTDLPIGEIIPEVCQKLNRDNTLIVHAPAGAGKSTILPLALLGQPFLEDQKIIMLEPRRLAASAIAARMSSLIGEAVGETVGYRIRFDTRVGPDTKIEVVTEGILTRMLHGDNTLEGIGMVIFDEFHERSIHADIALALCRETQQILRPELRIMIMSATLDLPGLSALLKAEQASCQGRQYPVDIRYSNPLDERMIPELTAHQVLKAAREEPTGDMLVFLPGQVEIKKCADILKKSLRGFAIHQLFGMMPPNRQAAAIYPNRDGRRKIVLATNIAETSLTIEGVTLVIDTGYCKTMKFDPRSGLSRLETEMITQDAADQRAGRAGRLSPGICYRMWSKATHDRLDEHRIPEILIADLAGLVLDLSRWGVTDVYQLSWLTPPPKAKISQARELLHDLNALKNGTITEHGKLMNDLPCHPRIAHMLIMAEKEGLLPLATDLAAIIEERDPLYKAAGIDINERIEALRKYRRGLGTKGRFKRIEKIAASYRKLFNAEASDDLVDSYETGILITFAYPERIACARPGNNAQFQLANGRYAMAAHSDDLAHEPWLAIAHLDAREGMGKIFLASPLNPRDLAPLVREEEVITWDTRKGGLIASNDLRIGNIILKSTPLPDPDMSQLQHAILAAVKKEGDRLLNFDEEVIQWQCRVMSLRRWNVNEGWPDVSTPAILMTCDAWLAPYLAGVKKPDDLKKIKLSTALHYHLPARLQTLLNELAPMRIEVPTGSQIKLTYDMKGEPPVLAVRLQEVFGLMDTPKINHGKTSILMHLLSPGYKPVQITSDLKSFWKNTYYEVRKELKRRYPKHEWPDDPAKAIPVRGVRRKK